MGKPVKEQARRLAALLREFPPSGVFLSYCDIGKRFGVNLHVIMAVLELLQPDRLDVLGGGK